MKALLKKLGLKRYDPAASALYQVAVKAARQEIYYTDWGVPDTVEGRFDMVSLMVGLINRRIGLCAPERVEQSQSQAQELFDVMFHDIDMNLRELGVSDEGMKKRIKSMASQHLGRMKAYTEALALVDDDERRDRLTEALVRNVYRDCDDATGAQSLAVRVLDMSTELDGATDDDILGGTFTFADAPFGDAPLAR